MQDIAMAALESVENGENFVKNCEGAEQQMESKAPDDELDNKEQIFDFDSTKFDGSCTDDDADEMEYEREKWAGKFGKVLISRKENR